MVAPTTVSVAYTTGSILLTDTEVGASDTHFLVP